MLLQSNTFSALLFVAVIGCSCGARPTLPSQPTASTQPPDEPEPQPEHHGAVIDAAGEPVPNAHVGFATTLSWLETGPVVTLTSTNAAGRFRFETRLPAQAGQLTACSPRGYCVAQALKGLAMAHGERQTCVFASRAQIGAHSKRSRPLLSLHEI